MAGQPKEALEMWLYQKKWAVARQLCQQHYPSGMHSVVEAQVDKVSLQQHLRHTLALSRC